MGVGEREEGGDGKWDSETMMEQVGGGGTCSVGRLDGLANKKQISAMRREKDRVFFESWVQDMEEGEEPPVRIVMFPDLVGKAWGWERLLPVPLNCSAVSWSDCITYLEMYLQNNAREQVPGAVAAIGSSIVANAEICLKKEEKLASEWKIVMKAQADVILRSKTIILSSLIKERALSVIHTKGVISSAAAVAAFVEWQKCS